MTRLLINLPEEINVKLRARAAQAGYASAEEYIQVLIAADASDPGAPSHLTFRTDQELEEFLLSRLDTQDAGEMTDDAFDAIRQKVQRVASQRRKP
jgi:plasmid stability protein